MNGQTLQKSLVALPGGGTAIYNSSATLAHYRHADHLGSSRLTATTSRTVYSDSAYGRVALDKSGRGCQGIVVMAGAKHP